MGASSFGECFNFLLKIFSLPILKILFIFMLVGLEKLTLVNFPTKVASAVFLPGCNMRCPFCHNAELALASSIEGITQDQSNNQYYPLEEVFSFLEKRRKLISGVVITGGEPFASPYLSHILERIKQMELAIKIDTNGLFPKRLKEVLYDKDVTPDMVAIDIKTSPNRYIELMGDDVKNGDLIAKKIIESLNILNKFRAENKNFNVDYRTVLVPNLVGKKEIEEIAFLLPKDAIWNFAEFVRGGCLNSDWNNLAPYSRDEIFKLISFAQSFIKNATLR